MPTGAAYYTARYSSTLLLDWHGGKKQRVICLSMARPDRSKNSRAWKTTYTRGTRTEAKMDPLVIFPARKLVLFAAFLAHISGWSYPTWIFRCILKFWQETALKREPGAFSRKWHHFHCVSAGGRSRHQYGDILFCHCWPVIYILQKKGFAFFWWSMKNIFMLYF